MPSWPNIPNDVIGYFRDVFAEANRQVTELLFNVPNVRETSLDDCLVNSLIPQSPPRKFPSGAVVEMDIHNIGGLRRLYHWETADIAVLVFIYRESGLIAQKIGLLQSKRLYPLNGEVIDEDPVGFRYGMNAMLRRDPTSPLHKLHRKLEFNEDCFYFSIRSQDDQVRNIENHNKNFGESIYYLLYTPPTFPLTVSYPVASRHMLSEFDHGCLVFRASSVHGVLSGLEKGASPSHRQLASSANSADTSRLERWAADLLLTCQVGQPFGSDKKALVSSMLERRSGPIAAAIAISIALPGD
jgi:hypothetical protein